MSIDRKMRSRTSLLTHFLPTRNLRRENQVYYSLNPARCHRTTVSGCTMTNPRFHPGQSRRKINQNNRSGAANRGCGCLCCKTASCGRRARFSKTSSRRERRNWVARTNRSLSKRNMKLVVHGGRPRRVHFYLLDLKADRHFGEPQQPIFQHLPVSGMAVNFREKRQRRPC